jgi:hypothetical protein
MTPPLQHVSWSNPIVTLAKKAQKGHCPARVPTALAAGALFI